MKKTAPKSSAGKPEYSLEQNALDQFATAHYKEATDLYKDLLKRSDNPFYRQQLAQCYLQRALAMSTKSMPKEAVVLWENYAEWAKPPLAAIDSYIVWLLASKNPKKAYARLEQLTAQQLDENFLELATWLGFLLLSGHQEIAGHLPQDSALIRHFGLAQEALKAYQNHNLTGMDDALKQLPFRSAFRDLRSLLKTQLTDAVSMEQTQTLLSKIPQHSPYRPVADALLAYTQDGLAFVETALKLDHNQRRIIAQAKGLSNLQTELLDNLSSHKDRQTDKLRFNLAIQYQALFGTAAAQSFCQATLADYPAGRKDYLKNFAQNDIFENNRIQALLCEQNRNGYDAIFFWRQCIKILSAKSPEHNQKIALILRHMSAIVPSDEAIELIIESLDYDAKNRNSYLKILVFYDQEQPDTAEYERWLALGMQHFPKDIELLARAAKSASDKKAFKKAATYAQELLNIDPVNSLAKQLLFNSHLAHTRKLIKTKKFHLVDKEIHSAEQIMVDKNLRRLTDLLRGFSVWANENPKQGLQLIGDALQKLNDDPINIQFQAILEAALLNAPLASITKSLPPIKNHLLSTAQLARLINLIKQYNEQISESQILFDALEKIKAPLKKSLQKQDYSEDLLLDWCRVLETIGHFELLKHTAKLAQAKWQKPIWLYFLVYAENLGNPTQLGIKTLFKLEDAIEEAREEHDHKTVMLISRFINSHYQNPFDFDDEYHDDKDEELNIFNELFGHLPDSVAQRIAQKIQTMTKKNSPEQFVSNSIQKYHHRVDQKKLIKLFNNPEFLSAIAFFSVADDLQIDVGVSFEDIIDRFENNSPQLSFPFF